MFVAAPDAVKPVITHSCLPDIPLSAWPPVLNASVVDPSDYGGLDSVWVRWYKNTPTNGIKHFKLSNTSGSTFTGTFNEPSSYVAIGDSIKYRIFAQDNSSAHNKDSSALFGFKMVSIATSCIGTGSTGVAWPFNTYWHDSRTQMLYTASEIMSNGGGSGSIYQIGFNVTTAQPQEMNGFCIRMQNSSLNSLTGFVETNWTIVYEGTYQVPGTGWQYITLQNGFNWNGTSNVLIDICYNNTSYTLATNVAATTVSGMCREYHTDGSAGCTLSSSNAVNRPNICLKINTLVGIPAAKIELPVQFELSQNYPNPFNPSTTINYSIPEGTEVSINVYDITGRLIVTLVNEFKPAGYYKESFDGANLASGIYVYRIEAGDFRDVKKMILIK
jgi:hypothetical protein